MTVETTTFRTDWLVADGANKDWPYDFRLDSASHVVVEVEDLDGIVTTYDSGFTLVASTPEAGVVIYPSSGAALAAGYGVRLTRRVPYKQEVAIGNQGAFYPQTHERAFDYLAMQIQQISSVLEDALDAAEQAATGATVATAAAAEAVLAAGQIGYQMRTVQGSGAVAGGTTNYSEFQAAFAASGRALRIPEGVYGVEDGLTNTEALFLIGDGMDNSIIEALTVKPGAAFLVDMATIDYPDSTGHRYRDFGIRAGTGGTRLVGFHIKLAGTMFVSNIEVDSVKVGEFTGWGMFFDNSVGNLDGFFVLTIRRCVIYNGFYAPNFGDSCNFETNQVTAGEFGENPAVYIEGVGGARQYIVRECNLTCRGGALVAIACDQLRAENNQMEHGWWYGNGEYTGDFDAHVYVKDSLQPIIRGNTMNPFYNFDKPIYSEEVLFTNGSPVLTSVADTSLVQVGDAVNNGDGLIPDGTTVLSKTLNTITLSDDALSTAMAYANFTRKINVGTAAAATIVIDGTCNEALIEDNDIQIGRVAHISIAAAAKNTRIGANRYYGSLTPTIADAGQGTMGVTKQPTLSGTWAANAVGEEVKYIKRLDGKVILQGAVVGGTMGTPIVTLPAGFRPSGSRRFVTVTTDGAVTPRLVIVAADGTVTPVGTGHVSVVLDGIEFDAPLVA